MLRLGPTLVATAVMPKMVLADNQPNVLASLSRQTFETYVNTSFEAVADNGESTWLTLTSVDDLTSQTAEMNVAVWGALPVPPRLAPPRLDVFALNFYGPPGSLTQATYTITHATLGTFPLLLVPAGYSSYAAIINRLVGPQIVMKNGKTTQETLKK